MHIETHFQRPDRIEQPLDVIVTVFNNARYRSRWKNHQDFISHAELAGAAIRLWTVEIAFGEREFVVTRGDQRRHLRLRTSTELWHKERSQNLLTQYVLSQCPEAEYFAFVDSDISFARHDWADETRHVLQHVDVAQMWREAYDLDAQGNIIHTHQSFVSCYEEELELTGTDYCSSGKLQRNYYHPGYAWAYRRRALDSVGGLIDWAILGSADFHMAYGLVGKIDQTLHRNLHPNYAGAMRRWQERAEAGIKRNVGFVPGTILHHWHGSKESRQYKSRWKILEETNFDQERDLVIDAQGLHQFQHHHADPNRSRNLRDLTRQYFHSRDEDANK